MIIEKKGNDPDHQYSVTHVLRGDKEESLLSCFRLLLHTEREREKERERAIEPKTKHISSSSLFLENRLRSMGTFTSLRKAYGALKDSTTVGLAKVNSEFKVRFECITISFGNVLVIYDRFMFLDFSIVLYMYRIQILRSSRQRIMLNLLRKNVMFVVSFLCFFSKAVTSSENFNDVRGYIFMQKYSRRHLQYNHEQMLLTAFMHCQRDCPKLAPGS